MFSLKTENLNLNVEYSVNNIKILYLFPKFPKTYKLYITIALYVHKIVWQFEVFWTSI